MVAGREEAPIWQRLLLQVHVCVQGRDHVGAPGPMLTHPGAPAWAVAPQVKAFGFLAMTSPHTLYHGVQCLANATVAWSEPHHLPVLPFRVKPHYLRESRNPHASTPAHPPSLPAA